MHMSISTAASGCRSPRPSAVGSEVLQAVLDELLKASGRTPPGASSGTRRIDFVACQRRRALLWRSASHGARAYGVQAALAREFAVVRRLAAEQGVLLSNRSSAGFETSARVSRHSSEQETKRFQLFFISITQPGPVAHACLQRLMSSLFLQSRTGQPFYE